jgi:MFS family permease
MALLTTGYIIASESIAWSALSILLANAPPERERLIITASAFMIATGIAGFAYAARHGILPLVLACAFLQGGGFGMAWPFVTRWRSSVERPAGESRKVPNFSHGPLAAIFCHQFRHDQGAARVFWLIVRKLLVVTIPFGTVPNPMA